MNIYTIFNNYNGNNKKVVSNLSNTSKDREGENAVCESEVQAINFDNFTTNHCSLQGKSTVKSIDALYSNDE